MKMCIKKSFVLSLLLSGFMAGQLTGQTFTNLYSFTGGSDGCGPGGSLIMSGNTLFGTTSDSIPGSSGKGTVFAINNDGTAFRTLYNFTGGNDGAKPIAGLTLSGNTLLGTASGGGSAGSGSIFAVNTDGTGFTTLYSFSALDATAGNTNT